MEKRNKLWVKDLLKMIQIPNLGLSSTQYLNLEDSIGLSNWEMHKTMGTQLFQVLTTDIYGSCQEINIWTNQHTIQ